MTYHIDIKRGLKRTRQAYNDRALAAQNGGSCRYSGKEGPCAIGAMLPIKVRTHLRGEGANATDFLSVCNLGLLGADSVAIRCDLQELQKLHDRWASRSSLEGNDPSYESAFESKLTQLEVKYEAA